MGSSCDEEPLLGDRLQATEQKLNPYGTPSPLRPLHSHTEHTRNTLSLTHTHVHTLIHSYSDLHAKLVNKTC